MERIGTTLSSIPIENAAVSRLKLHGDSILETVTPEASAFKVAPACRKPVSFYGPRSRAARLTRRLGDEILEKIKPITKARNVA